jgi:hypothetical protein
VLVLVWLSPLTDSPGHPQQIILVLLALNLLFVCELERTRSIAGLAGIGALTVSLALIKINVGVYIGGAITLALLRVTVPRVWTGIAASVLIVGMLLMPITVQAPLFDFWWVRRYTLFSTALIGGAIVTFLSLPLRATLKPQDWWVLGGTAAIVCVVVIGGMIVWGTTLNAILNAMIIQNVHFVRNWYNPTWGSRLGLVTSSTSLLAALAYRAGESRPAMRSIRDASIDLLKLGFVLAGIILLATRFQILFHALTPFCWLVMVQPAGMHQQNPFSRGVTGLVGAVMSLYPFPVAGGQQLAIGALFPVMFIPILASDLLSVYRHRIWAPLLSSPRPVVLMGVGIFAFGAVATSRSASDYLRAVPLDLPGTSLIRVDQSRADDIRWVAGQLSACSSSYSMPGMWSFSLWGHQALPTTLNVNNVLGFIQPAQQEEIVRALDRLPDLCVVYNPRLLQFFDRGQVKTDPPLLHYINTSLRPVAKHNDYIILKQRPSKALSGAG